LRECRRGVGAAVFGDMIAASLLGIFLIPVLSVGVRRAVTHRSIAALAARWVTRLRR
jgi:hypothetical protein